MTKKNHDRNRRTAADDGLNALGNNDALAAFAARLKADQNLNALPQDGNADRRITSSTSPESLRKGGERSVTLPERKGGERVEEPKVPLVNEEQLATAIAGTLTDTGSVPSTPDAPKATLQDVNAARKEAKRLDLNEGEMLDFDGRTWVVHRKGSVRIATVDELIASGRAVVDEPETIDTVFAGAPTPTAAQVLDRIIAENPDKMAQAVTKRSMSGWFVGQVMSVLGGQADINEVAGLMQDRLDKAEADPDAMPMTDEEDANAPVVKNPFEYPSARGMATGPVDVAMARTGVGRSTLPQVVPGANLSPLDETDPDVLVLLRYAALQSDGAVKAMRARLTGMPPSHIKALRETYDTSYGGSPEALLDLQKIEDTYQRTMKSPIVQEIMKQFATSGASFLALARDVQAKFNSDVLISSLTASTYQQKAEEAIRTSAVLKKSVLDLARTMHLPELKELPDEFDVPVSTAKLLQAVSVAAAHLKAAENRERLDHLHIESLKDQLAIAERRRDDAEHRSANATQRAFDNMDRPVAPPATVAPTTWVYAAEFGFLKGGDVLMQIPVNPDDQPKPRYALKGLSWTNNVNEALEFEDPAAAVEFLDDVTTRYQMQYAKMRDSLNDVMVAGVYLEEIEFVSLAIKVPPAAGKR